MAAGYGGGEDRFVFAPGHGHDLVFGAWGSAERAGWYGDSEKIDLSAFGGRAPTWAQIEARLTNVTAENNVGTEKSSVRLDLSDFGGGSITFYGTQRQYIDESDFIGLSTGDETLRGGASNDSLAGQDGNDVLLGLGGNDTLSGGAGADRLEGGDGNDSLYGGDGNDILNGSAGADRLDGGEGWDWVSYWNSDAAVSVNLATGAASGGHAQGDTLSNFEAIWGSAHADTLVGDGGINRIEGGAGADRLDGGGGGDWASYWNSDAAVSVNLATEAVSGGHAQGDTLSDFGCIQGSAHADTLVGDGGSNRIEGGAGADRLAGGAGSEDWVYYWNSSAAVSVNLATGEVSGGHASGDTITGFERIVGSRYADTLVGDSGANYLRGDGGADRLVGGTGRDTFVFRPGHGNDTITDFTDAEDRIELDRTSEFNVWASAPDFGQIRASAEGIAGGVLLDLSGFGGGTIDVMGLSLSDLDASDFTGLSTPMPAPTIPVPAPSPNPAATERGGSGAETLRGGAGDDNLYGEGGNDALLGRGGNDFIDGGAGNDKLWGEGGNDGLVGGSGNDQVWGGAGDDTVAGGDGRDIVLAGDGADQVRGDAGADKLFGGGGNDTLSGGADADFVAGGAGNDQLYGGAGKDYLAGESGNDVLVGGAAREMLAGGTGNDTLYGGAEGDTFFGQAGADTFVFAGGRNWVMDFEPGTDRLDTGHETSAEVRAAATQVGAHVHIELADDGGDVYLAWTTLGELAGQELV